MIYDFEKVGKQTVLNQLIKDIKGKAEFIQSDHSRKDVKLKTFKDLERMSKDAYKILSEL